MSDTQQGQEVDQAAPPAQSPDDSEQSAARAQAYQEVSLRAVELLAKAQRAADEAVAEAQSYAHDLEETAREQYQHILRRAHDAARAGAGVAADDHAADALAGDRAAGEGTLDARQLEYVRTYARVAHTQLKAVLGALSGELDRLADLADHGAEEPEVGDVVAPPPPHGRDDSEDAGEDDVELGHG